MADSIPETTGNVTEPRRKAVAKRLRFEILRRDNYACRYCGQMAPDVKLVVDHVIPVVLGGLDEPTNLVTACTDCNAGKSSAAPDQEIVADVEQDALRWRAAMMRATAMAIEDHVKRDEWMSRFLATWQEWTFGGKPVALPHNWRTALDSYRGVGLNWGDFSDAIELAMTGRYVRDEFAYMLTILRNRINERMAVARALVKTDTADAP